MLSNKGFAPIRVLLADDHPPLRAGMKARLEVESDITVVGEAGNGRDALFLARELDPNVLVLDMEMPDMTGVDVANQLKEEGTLIRILVLSAHEDPEYIIRMVEGGAVAGYLTKNESLDTIVAAVRGVARGEEGWLSREVAAALMKQKRGRGQEVDDSLDQLSRRELEVLQLIAQGFNNSQIGEELYIAESTVKKHVSNIYTKLELNSRAEVTAWAWKNGVIDSNKKGS
ncbi:MAG: response regulator transcription factor [Rhodothermaceae bacterium]|nr:response regulator transcription factor [Rhodothermaceae bacterium]